MAPDAKADVTVEVGEGVVVLRRKGNSRPVVANILGFDLDGEDRPIRLVLDRLVHRAHETEFVGWVVSGAYVSVLDRV